MNDEFLEELLSETLIKGNRHSFISRLKESKLLPQTLADMEPYADKKIGELLSKIVKSDYSMKTVGDLEDYIKTISKDRTFSEVFNMSKLEGDAVSQEAVEQMNKFLTPMNDMEQRIADIVKNAIKEEIAYKQQNAVSQFSDEDECGEGACPECGQTPCVCECEDNMPQDGRGCAAGFGADPEAIMNDKPSTELDDRVEDLEEAFSHISNILCRMKSRTKNFDDQEPAEEGQPEMEEPTGESENDKSKAYYDGLNTAKKLEEMPENPEEEAGKLADTFGYEAGSEDQADFIEGFMNGLSEDDNESDNEDEENDELNYSAEYDVFYSNNGDVFYYSDEYGVYANENGEVLYYSEATNEYTTKSGEEYFSELNFSQNKNNEVNNMKDVTIYFSDEDNCFFSEFGERLDWNPTHKAYVGENGSVYFSETGPQMKKSTDFSCAEKVALFSEKGTKIISYSEVDEDGDLICYSDDGLVLVYDKLNKCYFSADGNIYYDSEDLKEMEDEEKVVEPEAPVAAPDAVLPSAEQMAAEDNALVEPKDNIKEEVASMMADRVATNADAIPSEFAPAAPAPVAEEPVAPVEKEFSCVSFSEVNEDAVARYNRLQEYFSNN